MPFHRENTCENYWNYYVLSLKWLTKETFSIPFAMPAMLELQASVTVILVTEQWPSCSHDKFLHTQKNDKL